MASLSSRHSPSRIPPFLAVAAIAVAFAFGAACRMDPARGPGPSAPVRRSAERPKIRVLLLRNVLSFRLAVHGRYRVTDEKGNPLGPIVDRLAGSQVRVVPGPGPGLQLGPRIYRGRLLRIVPETPGTLEVEIKGRAKSRRYRGALHCFVRPDGRADVVNVLDIEAYVGGVLRGELPGYFEPETYRAQAIAARTYALYEKFTAPPGARWDVLATQGSQVYIGMDGETRRARNAIDSTRGVVCTWQSPAGEKIFCTYFSSTCGGMTQDAANVKPFRSRGVPRPTPLSGRVACTYCSASPSYRWPSVRLSKEDIGQALLANYPKLKHVGRLDRLEVVETTPDGRLKKLRVVWAQWTETFRSEDVRLCVGPGRVKSTHCRLTDHPREVEFSDGRGFGHGMGLCQWGAQGMARRGADASDILQHYYPGCGFAKAYE